MANSFVRYTGNGSTTAFSIPFTYIDSAHLSCTVLHILDRSKSAAHRPGERFRVYKIDYGCYVDLANTDRFPTGLLFAEMDDELELKDVPQDDARSYRRAILDISEFYRAADQGRLLSN